MQTPLCILPGTAGTGSASRPAPALSLNVMSTVTKASVYSRTGEDTPETPSLAAIDRFLDAVWMERGLSPNTLSAYRADLTALDRWLQARGGSEPRREACRRARIHRMARRSRRAAALDGASAVQLPPLLPLPDPRGRDQGRSDRADRDAEDRPLAAEVADRRRSRIAAGGAGDRAIRWAIATAPCSKCCTPPGCACRSW